MNRILCFVSLLALIACSGKKQTTRSTPPDLARTTAATPRFEAADGTTAGAQPAQVPSTPTGGWHYEKKVDQSGNPIYKASITSPDLLQFAFPHAGGSTATLTIRHRNDLTSLYLEVSRGQFNRSFQGGTARIRFDGGPTRNYPFSAAENGRANIIFFDSAAPLINQLKKAQTMTVDVDFYAQGRRKIAFRTANLNWNR